MGGVLLYCLRDGVGIYSLCQAFNDFGTFFNSNYPAVQRDMIVGGIAPLHIGIKAVISSAAFERACKFNMDTGCVELTLQDGRKIFIDSIGVEDALDVTMAQRSELDYLIYNDPLGYADLILNGDPEGYLKNVTGNHGLED